MSQPERMITLEVATKFHDQWDILARCSRVEVM